MSTNAVMPRDLNRARAPRGTTCRLYMSMKPEERQELEQLAGELALSDSATAAMLYRLGLKQYRAGQLAAE